jgi:hypothetical protein
VPRRARQETSRAEAPDAVVEQLLADPQVGWLPVRHHSPAAAFHAAAWIREHRPAAVLIEAPEDAAGQLRWLLHEGAEPPLALLFSFKGDGGRVRWLWPLLAHDPEWVALRAAAEIGAEVRLIDAPVRALHAVGGLGVDIARSDAEVAYLRALAAASRRPTFDAFWASRFEPEAHRVPTERFRRAVLLLAACARAVHDHPPGPATALREAHLRWAVDQARADHAGQRIAVVVGAMHAVAVPSTRPKRARARADASATVMLAATSSRALARRGIAAPEWGAAGWQAMHGGPEPALRALVEVAAAARRGGAALGTADAIGAVEVARGLAALRGGGVTLEDVEDGARAALIKGAADQAGGVVARALAEVLVGTARGRLPPEAGRPPLVEDFYAEVAAHRLTLGDRVQEIRCAVADKPRHQAKSAFLHRCRALEIPMFGPLPGGRDEEVFRGPSWAERADLHLTIERWGVCGDLAVDDRLLELADSGTTVAEAAGDLLLAQRRAAGDDVAERARILLRAAQMRLDDLLPTLLVELEDAVASGGTFHGLVEAMADLQLLWGYRRSLPTHGDARVARVRTAAYDRACLALPGVRAVADPQVDETVDAMQALTRFAATEATADRELLTGRLRLVADDADAQPRVRGAATGLLAGLGEVRIEAVADELSRYLRGAVDDLRRGGAFLEGVLETTRSASIRSRRLIGAVHDVLLRLPDEDFVAVLPDLRRAFSVFVPAEIERLGEQVARLLAGEPDLDPDDAPLPEADAATIRALDGRIAERLRELDPSS